MQKIKILDVGCDRTLINRIAKKNKNYNIECFMFEPDKSNINQMKLDSETHDNFNINLNNYCLSKYNKILKFYKNYSSTTSSIYKSDINEVKLVRDDKFFDFISFSKIKSKNLKYFFTKNKVNKIDFMSLYTQGSELDILKGAQNQIKNISIIRCHAFWIHLYKNNTEKVKTPLIGDVISYLNKCGFKLFHLNPNNTFVDKQYNSEMYFINKRLFYFSKKNKKNKDIITCAYILAYLGKYTEVFYLLKKNKVKIETFKKVLSDTNYYYSLLMSYYPYSKIFYKILQFIRIILGSIKIKIPFLETEAFFVTMAYYQKK